jgi:hypothetical protein
MLVIISSVAAVLVLAGLYYATGVGQRHKAALAAAECEPNLSPSGLQCTTVRMLVRQYGKITTPAIQQLNADVAAYTANETHNLAAAKAALRAEVTLASALDASLARFPFPPAIAPTAKALIRAIHARVTLTAKQARSASLARLRKFNVRVKAASAAVQAEMKLMGKIIATRPTVSQEP